jgi:hypothetical protein
MCALSASDLLNLWDSGSGRDHTTRALLLLRSANGGAPDPADLPIGERDRRLFDLRQRAFGAHVDAVESCPSCSTRLEITFQLDDVRMDRETEATRRFTLDIDDFQIDVRLPTSGDLLAIRNRTDLDGARRELLGRCVVGITNAGSLVSALELTSAVEEAIAGALAEHDPQAEVLLDLECASCGHTWQRYFDIVEYLWTEVDRTARRLLRNVHTLSAAYGWSETAILQLSPGRRAIYLGMVSDA